MHGVFYCGRIPSKCISQSPGLLKLSWLMFWFQNPFIIYYNVSNVSSWCNQMCLADGSKLLFLSNVFRWYNLPCFSVINSVPSFYLRSVQSGQNFTLILFSVAAWTGDILYPEGRRYEEGTVVLTNESVELGIVMSKFPLFKATFLAWVPLANSIQLTSFT